MYQFTITHMDSCISALYINNIFQKYIKREDIPQLNKDIEEFLIKFGVSTPPDFTKTTIQFSLDLSLITFEQFKDVFLIGKNRKPIILPTNLSCTLSDKDQQPKPIIISYRPLNNFKKYWKDKSNDRRLNLYQQLSKDIIEIPYVEVPFDYEYRFNQIAFHPNHGTAHGIRLVILFNHYLNWLKFSELSVPVNNSFFFSDDEEGCLELAMFLFRTGRTSEVSWSEDTLYSPRSAAIFHQIALDLGYEESLVNTIVQCFDYEAKIEHVDGFYNLDGRMRQRKTNSYQSLFKLAHTSDLVRCNSNLIHLMDSLLTVLKTLEMDVGSYSLDHIAYSCLAYAADCCANTGAPVVVKELQQDSGGSYSGNRGLMVKSVAEVKNTFLRLSSIKYEMKPQPEEYFSSHWKDYQGNEGIKEEIKHDIFFKTKKRPEEKYSILSHKDNANLFFFNAYDINKIPEANIIDPNPLDVIYKDHEEVVILNTIR